MVINMRYGRIPPSPSFALRKGLKPAGHRPCYARMHTRLRCVLTSFAGTEGESCSMSKSFAVFVITITLLLVFIVGCDGLGSSSPNAADLLPDLAGYNTIEGQSFTEALTTLGVLATLAGQPELGAPLATVSGVATCYQDAGAVNARVYSEQGEPVNSGIVAVGDRNALLNPITFLQCVPGRSGDSSVQSMTIDACSHSYTLARDGNEFYILYAGLTPEMCQTFCSNLEGCTGHLNK